MASRSDILLHPVRLRIVLAVAGDEVTTAALGRRLPDVPTATLYRQVATLIDSGILEIVRERQVRGGVERTYRVVAGAASLDAGEAGGMSRDQHRAAFVTFVGTLVEAFGRYLDDPDADPATDGVSYRQVALWLDDDELEALASEYAALLATYAGTPQQPGRRRRTLSTILIPDPTSE